MRTLADWHMTAVPSKKRRVTHDCCIIRTVNIAFRKPLTGSVCIHVENLPRTVNIAEALLWQKELLKEHLFLATIRLIWIRNYKLNEGTNKDLCLPKLSMKTKWKMARDHKLQFAFRVPVCSLASCEQNPASIWKQLSVHLFANWGPFHEYDSRSIVHWSIMPNDLLELIWLSHSGGDLLLIWYTQESMTRTRKIESFPSWISPQKQSGHGVGAY